MGPSVMKDRRTTGGGSEDGRGKVATRSERSGPLDGELGQKRQRLRGREGNAGKGVVEVVEGSGDEEGTAKKKESAENGGNKRKDEREVRQGDTASGVNA
jgi:hypothetical protein